MNIYDPIADALNICPRPEIYESISYDDHPHTSVVSWNKGKTGVQSYGDPWNKGLKGVQHHTEKSKTALSKAAKGRPRSEETKRKISLGNQGKIVSKETKEKLKIAGTGKNWSVDRKHKYSELRTGGKLKRVSKTCPHCNKTGSGPNMTRYHFDKCSMVNHA